MNSKRWNRYFSKRRAIPASHGNVKILPGLMAYPFVLPTMENVPYVSAIVSIIWSSSTIVLGLD